VCEPDCPQPCMPALALQQPWTCAHAIHCCKFALKHKVHDIAGHGLQPSPLLVRHWQ
jgi:hypothetical protein